MGGRTPWRGPDPVSPRAAYLAPATLVPPTISTNTGLL